MALSHHEKTVTEQNDADAVKQVKRADHRRIGLEKFPYEPLQCVPAYEKIKAPAQEKLRAMRDRAQIDDEKQDHRSRFIKLHRMPADAVAEVHRPRQRG